MEIDNEDEGIEQLLTNKNDGYSRLNPQNEAQQRKKVSESYDCPSCEKKFRRKEEMASHQKTHEVRCTICEKMFKTDSKLKEHVRKDHEEMICHVRCEGSSCSIEDTQNTRIDDKYKCNFCDERFSSNNALSTHKLDVHRSYKPCRDIANCVYQAGCYFSHVPVTLGKFRCFQCGEEFTTKNTMMIHRKIHRGVQECRSLINNQCNRGESCWWSHKQKDKSISRLRRTFHHQY